MLWVLYVVNCLFLFYYLVWGGFLALSIEGSFSPFSICFNSLCLYEFRGNSYPLCSWMVEHPSTDRVCPMPLAGRLDFTWHTWYLSSGRTGSYYFGWGWVGLEMEGLGLEPGVRQGFSSAQWPLLPYQGWGLIPSWLCFLKFLFSPLPGPGPWTQSEGVLELRGSGRLSACVSRCRLPEGQASPLWFLRRCPQLFPSPCSEAALGTSGASPHCPSWQINCPQSLLPTPCCREASPFARWFTLKVCTVCVNHGWGAAARVVVCF